MITERLRARLEGTGASSTLSKRVVARGAANHGERPVGSVNEDPGSVGTRRSPARRDVRSAPGAVTAAEALDEPGDVRRTSLVGALWKDRTTRGHRLRRRRCGGVDGGRREVDPEVEARVLRTIVSAIGDRRSAAGHLPALARRAHAPRTSRRRLSTTPRCSPHRRARDPRGIDGAGLARHGVSIVDSPRPDSGQRRAGEVSAPACPATRRRREEIAAEIASQLDHRPVNPDDPTIAVTCRIPHRARPGPS